MTTKSVTLEQFREQLTPENLKSFQIIPIAVAMGVVVFYVVIFILGPGGESVPDMGTVDQVRWMTIGHFALSVIASFVAPMLYFKTLSGNDQAPASGKEILGRMRSAEIVRLAVYDGVAFIGAIICFLAMQNGVMAQQPLYWLNGITTIILFLQIWRNFPTEDRLTNLFRAKFQN